MDGHSAIPAAAVGAAREPTASDWSDQRELGRTGLAVSRLGVASSYGAGAPVFERAFERGVNYFYWGSLRRGGMRDAVRHLARRYRQQLVVVVQSYARWGMWVKRSVHQALRSLRLDYADILLLGLHSQPPARRILDAALQLREQGHVRHLALSGHRRELFAELIDDAQIAVWHVRYNAVHRKAEATVFSALERRDPGRRPGLVTFTTTRWGHLVDPRRVPPGERTPTGTDCYRFALSQPAVDVVMSGPANEQQMSQALAALEAGPMSDQELAWMRRVGDHIYRNRRSSWLGG
jgi:aryl-alcohol dehydrogenase-like predicted oxidoreductase